MENHSETVVQEIEQIQNKLVHCNCGDILSCYSLPVHFKSKRHIDNLRMKEDPIEQTIETLRDLIKRKVNFQFTCDNNDYSFVVYN